MLCSLAVNEEALEELTNAADYLGLEHLKAQCLSNLVQHVLTTGAEQTRASVSMIRWALEDWVVCVSTEAVCVFLKALASRAVRGDLHSLAVVLLYIDSAYAVVREAAIQGIARLAPSDDAMSSLQLKRCLCDESCQVQHAALVALGEVVSRGGIDIISAVRSKCSHENVTVRSAAMDALGRVALHGDADAIAALKPGLADKNASVRKSAAQGLSQVGV